MFLGTRTKCFLDDSREEEACRESRTSSQPILPIQTSRLYPFHPLPPNNYLNSTKISRRPFPLPIHHRVTPSIVIPSRKCFSPSFANLLFRVSWRVSRRLDKIENGGREGGREEESKRQERYRAWSGIRVEEGGRGRERKRGTTSSRPDHSKFPGGNKGPATSWSNYPIHLNWRASERISARRYQEVHFTAFEHHPSSYETLPSKFMHVPYAAIQCTTSPLSFEGDFDVGGKIGALEGRRKRKKKKENVPLFLPLSRLQ